MVMFGLQNAEGKFLNTDYHSRFKHGIWRDEPRLYKSKRGIRSALYGDSFVKDACDDLLPPKVMGKWFPHATQESVLNYHARSTALNKIKDDEYFSRLAKAGYTLKEFTINGNCN